MKKVLSVVLIVSLMVSLFVGCGTEESGGSAGTETAVSEAAKDSGKTEEVKATTESDSKEPAKLVLNLGNQLDNVDLQNALEEVMAMDKYSHVEFDIMEKPADYETKTAVSIAGGEQMDLIAIFNPIQKDKFASSDTIQPMTDALATLGVDFEATYGPYVGMSSYQDNPVMIPYGPTKWALYYNKNIFDDAGIPYPDSEKPMSWDEYRDLAKRLTSGEGDDKIYGACHLTWPMFWYGEAIMKLGGGEQFYTADGLSNIEDPAFVEAMEATYDMMHVDESIPTHADNVISKRPATAFMNGKYGLFLQGSWLLNWAADKETYPRDWELGVVPMPIDSGTTTKSWGGVGGFAVPQTSENPELAVAFAMDLTRVASANSRVQAPTDQTVVVENLFKETGEQLGGEGLTQEHLVDIFAASDTIMLTEKVSGPNAAKYETVIIEEVEKYFVQEQSLEDTIANIKRRGDETILED